MPKFARGISREFCLDDGDATAGISTFDMSTVLFDKLEGSPPDDPALRFDEELAFR